MTKNLTTGNPMRLIIGFTLPTLFGMLFQQMYNMVDTMIVGRLLGAHALAAVGATGSINFLVIGFCIGICSGFAIPVARAMGAGDHSTMRQYAVNGAYLSVAFALVLTTSTALLCGNILRTMNTPGDIYADAYNYIFIIFLGIPATFLYNLLAGIIRSLGDSRTPVYFLAMSSVLNIALDIVLILYSGLGVAGAALATVISQGVSGLACLVFMYYRFPILRLNRSERRLAGRLCRELCAMGLPMGLQYSVTAIGSIVLQTAVNGLGSLYVAATAAGAKLMNFLACPYDAMGAAMATWCGQNTGAGKPDRLSQGIKACSLLGLGYAIAAFGAMVAFAPTCAAWFVRTADEAELSLLIGLISRYIRVAAAFGFPLALVNILRFAIQGMGYSLFAVLAGVLEMIARAGVGRFAVPVFGFGAVCFASPAAWICADLFLIPACILCVGRIRKYIRLLHRHDQRAIHAAIQRIAAENTARPHLHDGYVRRPGPSRRRHPHHPAA